MRLRVDAQSIGFAVDLCRALQTECAEWEEGTYTLLDVGARTGSGSNLIATTFHPDSWSRIGLRVTAIDVDPHWSRHALLYPAIDYRTADVFEMTGPFDVVVCSHTLEHIADPAPFMEHLLGLATRLVVIAAPWKEPLDTRLPYHLHSFDESFFERFPPSTFEVYRSPHWNGGDCFIATYRLGDPAGWGIGDAGR